MRYEDYHEPLPADDRSWGFMLGPLVLVTFGVFIAAIWKGLSLCGIF